MKNRQRILLLLIIVSLIFSFVGCSGEEPDREYDEAEVISEAKRLIPLSAVLNEIYYGKGIGYEENSNENLGAYKIASQNSLSEYGITTIEDLKAKTRTVFSENVSNTMFSTVLAAIADDDDTIVRYARYYQKTDDKGNPIAIMVLSNYDYVLKNEIEYGDNITVADVEGQIIKLSVPVRLTREDGTVKEKTLTIEMIEEESGWRLASATYAIYNASTEIYEDLLDRLEQGNK